MRLVALLLVAACASTPAAPPPPGTLGMSIHFPRAANGEWMSVCGVKDGSPAAAAGIRLQDVIVAVNGRPIREAGEDAWLLYFRALRTGDRVVFTVAREGANRDLTLVAR